CTWTGDVELAGWSVECLLAHPVHRKRDRRQLESRGKPEWREWRDVVRIPHPNGRVQLCTGELRRPTDQHHAFFRCGQRVRQAAADLHAVDRAQCGYRREYV